MQRTVRSSDWSDWWETIGVPSVGVQEAIERASVTTIQPVGVTQVVSITSVPGMYRRLIGVVTPLGRRKKWPASRSSRAPKTLGESKRGRQSHSTAPPKETSAEGGRWERKPYPASGGKPSGWSGALGIAGS